MIPAVKEDYDLPSIETFKYLIDNGADIHAIVYRFTKNSGRKKLIF